MCRRVAPQPKYPRGHRANRDVDHVYSEHEGLTESCRYSKRVNTADADAEVMAPEPNIRSSAFCGLGEQTPHEVAFMFL